MGWRGRTTKVAKRVGDDMGGGDSGGQGRSARMDRAGLQAGGGADWARARVPAIK